MLNLWHAWMMPRLPKSSKRPSCTARMLPVPFSIPTWTMCWPLECKAKAIEVQDHQAFTEAFGAAAWICLPESLGALHYPLQILTSDIPLAAILGISATAQLWAVAGTGMAQMPPTPSASETLMLQSGGICQCLSSNQTAPTCKEPQPDKEEVIDDEELTEECPWKKWKALKEAFSKESNLIKAARWPYLKTHHANFKQEGSYDLSSIFHQIVASTNLLDAKVFQVQETWDGRRNLKTTNWVARTSPKDILFFWLVLPTESLKIMGLKGIHSSRGPVMPRWPDLLPLVWEGRSEWGNSSKPPCLMLYHLGLICTQCLSYFTITAEAMCHHGQGCKPTTAGTGNNDNYAKYEDKDNDDEDDKFKLKED